ncbi:cytochrome c oxidase subunit 8A, mitochondrial [Ictidomys tridecemlineatus]|uniref:Cytochrome c oxidase subunit 8 n=4 Tax=Marmotini TaxID=337730 RepID=I3MH76_ICTTR|nr:cytochrome c oxidase subunit 8A, mitochondrial [Ictidomys tridecemlineatus]XP_015333637.1 cytochrome c oxidase subunit 8A, mitochondrial [Marmota marmota marmota]XP_026270229.1 cytochrome c oxidase subunit 8A, mitochondrial [Urocitellus parryii]XP_027800206.1 cytochrome c oxidase subunit 8A, mitochondrial [Marmota flaviventris]KAG3284802.1 cytochrome c oxidase subunit 8A, mitochondrial [Ictidomys tridecemlineatus]
MSVLTPLLLRGLTGPARRLLVPRAQVHSKPPREQLGTMDITIGLTSCFLCFLLPAGWVLSHLESYKKRE